MHRQMERGAARTDPRLGRLKPSARYIAFYCADTLEQTLDGTGQYYETIDLVDAFHPQTILAYDMNDEPLPVAHGAPLRLRVERQLGYKMAKYVMRIEAIKSFDKMDGAAADFGKIAVMNGTRHLSAPCSDGEAVCLTGSTSLVIMRPPLEYNK